MDLLENAYELIPNDKKNENDRPRGRIFRVCGSSKGRIL